MMDVGASPTSERRPWSPIAFRGRLGRVAFAVSVVVWHVAVGLGAGLVFLFVLAPWLSLGAPGADGGALGFGALVVAAYAVGMASFVVRRLRDLGRSVAWAALGFVPIVNLVLLVVLLVAPGATAAVGGLAPPNAVGAASATAVGTDRWAGIAASVRTAQEEAEGRHEAAFDEGRRFAERRARRAGADDPG